MAEIARRLGVCTSAIGRAVRKIEGRDERLNFSTPAPSSPSQTFGDFLGFNPHCHVLVTDGCFYGRGMFRVAPPLHLKKLEAIFRHRVFKMLLAGLPSPRNGCSISQNPQRLFTGRKTEPRKRSSMPWSGWPPCAPTSRTGGSPADGGSSVLWVLQQCLPGKAKRNRRRTGPLHPGSR